MHNPIKKTLYYPMAKLLLFFVWIMISSNFSTNKEKCIIEDDKNTETN